jgi:prepilin-type N-terminal cleavage/methylation domain-containing protein
MLMNQDSRRRRSTGFTLIELLIVIAIIGFLAAAILVAVDPVKRTQQARNANRWAEVNSLLNAVLNKQVDERTQFDGSSIAPIITDANNAQVIVRDSTGVSCGTPAAAPSCPTQTLSTTGVNCVADLSDIVPEYIAELPLDPLEAGAVPTAGNLAIGDNNTGYYIHRTANGRLEIGSCHPDLSEVILVKR